MLIEGVVAIAAGIAAHSVALTAFGFDSFIELFSAAVVLRRVLERSPAEERGSRTPGERTASRLVGWALCLVIAYIVAAAFAGLLLKLRPEPSPTGLSLTLASIVIMGRPLEMALGAGRSTRQSSASRRRRLLGRVPVHGHRHSRRPHPQQPARLVVGRSCRRTRPDLVDPGRSKGSTGGSVLGIGRQPRGSTINPCRLRPIRPRRSYRAPSASPAPCGSSHVWASTSTHSSTGSLLM